MAKGSLRTAVEDFMKDNPLVNSVRPWWKEFLSRTEYISQGVRRAVDAKFSLYKVFLYQVIMSGVYYQFVGVDTLRQIFDIWVNLVAGQDLSESVADAVRVGFSSPLVKELSETVGSLITEPVLALFEQYAGRDDKDPKEFARAFHGFVSSISMGSGLANLLVEVSTAGSTKGVGKMFEQLYWSLGLGFLGWQTLAPLLSSGLQPGLERYYNKLYRPMRFSASDLRDLYALGEITKDQLYEGARAVGWRDQDIDQWLKLAFRTLGMGDIFDAFHEGFISESEAERRLRGLGYAPEDIPLLFKLNPKDTTKEAETVTLTTARQAYREGVISEADLRSMMKELKRDPREIELIVKLENLKKEGELRALSISQIKAAWSENIITRPEAVHYLKGQSLGDAEIEILVKTWEAEAAPVFRLVNKGTIVGAYVEGVLGRAAALEKLKSVGFSQEDASLELSLAEAKNPESFGKPKPKPAKYLTPSLLSDALSAGIISDSIMRSKLVEAGYTAEDADITTRAAVEKAKEKPLDLNQRLIERAYAAQVITRSKSHDILYKMGFDEDEISIILNTVEKENPAVFAPESVQSVRLPTIQTVVQAVLNQLIGEAEYYAKAKELGYSEADAALYLTLGRRGNPAPVKQLSQAQIVNAYGKGLFSKSMAGTRLIALGYSEEDTETLLRMEKSGIYDTQTWTDLLNGTISAEDAVIAWLSMGFTEAEITAALEKAS